MKPLPSVRMNDLRGGLNSVDSVYETADNEATDLLNMRPILSGPIESRAGSVDLSASLGGNLVDELYSWQNIIPVSRLQDIGYFDEAFAYHTLYSGTAKWGMTGASDALNTNTMWFSNGVDTPQKWDGVAPTTSDWTGVSSGGLGTGGNLLVVWRNRVVMSGFPNAPELLYFSNIGDPDTFDNSNFEQLRTTDDGNQPIVGLEILEDVLIVLKRDSIWRITGEIPNITSERIGSPGPSKPGAHATLEGTLYFWDGTSVWATDGRTAPTKLSELADPVIQSLLAAPNLDDSPRVAATLERSILVMFGSSSGAGRYALEVCPLLTLKRNNGRNLPSCFIHDLNLSDAIIYENLLGHTKQFVGFNRATTKLQEPLGSPSVLDYTTSRLVMKTIPLVDMEPIERVRRVNVLSEGSFTLTWSSDLSPDKSQDFGSTRGTPTFERFRPESRGRYHHMSIENTEGIGFKLHELEIIFRGGTQHT